MNRHEAILKLLQQKQEVEVQELTEQLNVSAVTIRKDLNQLAQRGLLFRSRGGATLRNIYTPERPVNEKENLNQDEKIAIAREAEQMVGDYQSILIASGTTVLNLARFMGARENLTAITNSVQVSMALAHKPGLNVIQLGGELRKNSFSATGYYAELALKDMTCEHLFLGIDGLDFNQGLTTTSLGEALINKRMIDSSQEVTILADSSKFGRRGFGRICGIEEVNTIITDSAVSLESQARVEEMGVQLITVNSH